MKCKIDGCDREANVRGMCKPHYVKSWKLANVSIEHREGNEMYNTWANKKGKRVKEWDDFEVFKRDIGAHPGPGYRLCRISTKDTWGPENAEWRAVELPRFEGETLQEYSVRAVRRCNLKKKYDLTPEEYEAMLEKQGGVCAICKSEERSGNRVRLAVDHNHKTGKVRGLLCSGCNTALGQFNEDLPRMKAALAYLLEYRSVYNAKE